MGTSSPITMYCWSNMMSISSWLVEMRASGTLTIERPACWASALIRSGLGLGLVLGIGLGLG